MPAKSQKQANLMRAAAAGASFPMAQKVRSSMSLNQIKDFETVKPKHNPAKNLGKFHHPPKSTR